MKTFFQSDISKLRNYLFKSVFGPVSVPVKGRKGRFLKFLKRYTDTDPEIMFSINTDTDPEKNLFLGICIVLYFFN